MAGFIPAIHVFVALEQVVDARVKPGHDESSAAHKEDREKTAQARRYSAGVGLGGGLAGGGVVAEAFAAAAFFSTMRTAMIEPS
jgi:hypothetical protein